MSEQYCYQPRLEVIRGNEVTEAWQNWGIFNNRKEAQEAVKDAVKEIQASEKWQKILANALQDDDCQIMMSIEKLIDGYELSLVEVIEVEAIKKKQLSEVYKTCMSIGDYFHRQYEVEKTKDWRGTEECATLAELTYRLMQQVNISVEEALDTFMQPIIACGYQFKDLQDRGYDDYARGFLAGQILGIPTEENLAKAEEAEKMWSNDDGSRYGYYQEVLNQITNQ